MKIPLEWLSQYISTDKSTKEIAHAFTLIGLLLDKPITTFTNNEYSTEVLDLEHRMDRADWLSIIGCARDLACYLGIDLNLPKVTSMPQSADIKDKIVIEVDCPELVNRFTTVIVKGVKVDTSPSWLANRLQAYGIASINNVVDVTNYVMVEMGQPMHAQDISKLKKREIHIRRARSGESLTTFLGETLTLDDQSFVLCQDDIPTVLGGIVGTDLTGVDTNTTDIVLDAGNYNQVNIRKTSRRLKVLNETVLRYDKLLSPKLTLDAILRASHLIAEVAGGKVYFNNDYISDTAPISKTMALTKQRLELLAGNVCDLAKAQLILQGLGYEVLKSTSSMLEVTTPHFRTDIEVEDDLVADVLRITGYDTITSLPLSGPVPEEITPVIVRFEYQLKDRLVACGLNEYITSPFVERQFSERSQIVLDSAVNKDQNALRTSLLDTLKPILSVYRNNNLHIRGLFEIGKVYTHKNGNYSEKRQLQVILNAKGSPYETSKLTKETLATLMHSLGIEYVVNAENEIYTADTLLGKIDYDNFHLDTQALEKVKKTNKVVKTKIENLVIRDITLIVPEGKSVGVAIKYISETYPKVTKIEVISEFLEGDQKTRTIGIRLYFEESIVDASKHTSDILKDVKNTLEIDNKSLVI